MNNLFYFWTGFTPVKSAIAFSRASRISWIFFIFLPSLMEGRKFNPAYRREKEP
jgi:hypothetical protein